MGGFSMFSFDLFGWLFRGKQEIVPSTDASGEADDEGARNDDRGFYFFGMFPML